MIKLFELLTRRSDMTHDEAMTYWTTKHAPLVKRVTGNSGPARRYLNNVGIATAFGPADVKTLCYDGVVEGLTDTTADQLCEMISTPGNEIIADEPNFLSRRPDLMIVEPLVLKPFRAPFQTKLLMFWKRRQEMTQVQAEAIWLETHAPAELAAWGDVLKGFVVNRSLPAGCSFWGKEMPLHDGVAEYYFDVPHAQLPARWAQAATALSEGTSRFASDVRLLCVSEVVQIGDGPGPG